MTLDTRDRIALAFGGLAILLIGAGSWLLLGAAGGTVDLAAAPSFSLFATDAPLASAESQSQLVVDVEGGVLNPGIVILEPGARVADAIRAAGGYAEEADLEAAAAALNLAAQLADGAQVYVPLAGDPVAATGAAAKGSLIDLNTATADELESLPGIGPVTAQKIVTARTEQPFTTLDELVDRKVMNRGQLDGIRDLVTV